MFSDALAGRRRAWAPLSPTRPREEEVLSYLDGDTSREEEGGAAVTRTQGGGRVGYFYSYLPQAASDAIRVIMLRWMPRSSSSRLDRFDSSLTVWR